MLDYLLAVKCAVSSPLWLICNAIFYRFQKDDLVCLGNALQLPPKYVCHNGTSASGVEALLILFRRRGDLVPLFGRAELVLSAIFSEVS